MVPILAFLLFLSLAGFLFVSWFLSADPQRLATFLRSRAVRWTASAVAIGAGVLIMLRGGFGALGSLISLALFLAPMFLNLRAILNRLKNRAGPTPGGSSGVETAWLRMDLDHDTGAMDGVILQGPFRGRQLSDLLIEELLALLAECRADDPQSAALVETYLDRTAGPDWRDASRQAGRGGAGTAMSEAEARDVLGVSDSATRSEIMDAFRSKIRQHHPDLGGSEEMAARINEAKRVLLGE